MFGIMFTDTTPTEYRDWAKSDHALYDAIAIGMQPRGAMPEPDSREPWFVCEAHAGGDDVDRVITAFEGALKEALDARARGEVGPAATGAQSHPTAG
jgi:glutamate-1-semialdehyde 2,1-aminomutase